MGLSLDEAVKLALENNLDLRKNRIDLDSSAYSEKKLWSEIFPTINANGSATFFSTPLFSGEGFDVTDYKILNNIGASVGVSLGLNAGIPYTIKNIKLAHQISLLSYEDARNQIEIQVTKKFYSLIAEKNNLQLLEEVLNQAQRQYDSNRVSFRNGLIREIVVLQSSLAVENARYEHSTASISYANNMNEFLDMLGIQYGAEINLSGEINIVKIEANTDALIGEYLSKRPDIVRNNQTIQRLENSAMQLAMRTKSPTLNLSMNWRSTQFDPFADNFSGTAAISIPIDPWIPGTSQNQNVRVANDAVEKAKLDLTITEDAAKNQIRSLTGRLRNSWNSIEIARLSLNVAQRNYQLTDQGFRNGTVESLVLEDARNNMANARQRLLQTELSYFNMILDLSAAINMDWKDLIQTYGVTQ
jgi:multidrug efflux system outer membrane protein